jgi:hypothetical protein
MMDSTLCWSFQRGDKLVRRAEPALAERRRGDRVDGIEFLRRIGAGIDFGGLNAGMTEPQRDFPDIVGGLENNHRTGVAVTGGVIVYKNRRFENVPAKKGRRCRKQAAEQAAQDSIWSFMR